MKFVVFFFLGISFSSASHFSFNAPSVNVVSFVFSCPPFGLIAD